MPATALTVTTLNETVPVMPQNTVPADIVNTNTFPNGPTVWLEATNTAGAAATVTVAYASQVDGQTIPARSYTLPAPISTTLASAVGTVGAVTISTTATIPVGSLIAIDTGNNTEYRVTTAVSGAGPFTVTVPALSLTHLISVPVVVSGTRRVGVFPLGLFGANPIVTSSATTVGLAVYQVS
jgi:hypothetical protein